MKTFLRTAIASLNPNLYSTLCQRSYKKTVIYFLLLILTFTLLSFILSSPSIIKFYSSFDENLEKIDNLGASFQASTQGEVILLSNPLIVVDSSRNSTNGEYLLITDDIIYKRKIFGYKEIKTDDLNLVQTLKESKLLIILFLVLSLPTFIFLFTLFNVIKYLLLAILISLVALIIIRLLGYDISTRQIFDSSLYSIIILLLAKILLIINFKYVNLIPLLLYVGWYILVLILLNDSKIGFKEDVPKIKNLKKKQSKSANINLDPSEMQKLKELTKGK
ncbi:hypothetical protein C0585_08285 [Candidatus Woesearchaeota archaeon]|nr:MAG: hypothetical protein C0585_08285 [Candidatus Woesearchaeota archaeon]